MNKYEGMFLLDHGKVKNEPQKGIDEITAILEKNQAKVAKIAKWDERKLAFEIRKQKRGTYILSHFEAPESAIAEIRQTAHLSEIIARSIIVRIETEFPPFMTASELDAAHGSREFRDRPSRFDGGDRDFAVPDLSEVHGDDNEY